MNLALAVPFVLGCLAVLQVALNKRIAGTMGLTQAVMLNAGVLLGVAVVFWLYARGSREDFGEWMSGSGGPADFRLWWLVPGLCGLALVAGLPWAVERVGALQAFVALVAAQMLFSIAWDYFAGGVAISAARVVGAGLAVAGAAITTLRS